jgi:hypothetical protein
MAMKLLAMTMPMAWNRSRVTATTKRIKSRYTITKGDEDSENDEDDEDGEDEGEDDDGDSYC